MNRNHVFDSNGPDMRLRGTAQQLFEKYLQLGRDATSASDRVMAESYFQHAEHYFRILNAMSQAAQQQGGPPQHQQRRYQNGPDQDGGGEGSGEQPDLNRNEANLAQQIHAPQYGNGHADRGNGHAMDQDDQQPDPRDRDRDQRDG
nr:DUF4167 domain-containing protein [Roseomonas ponticola]